MPLDEAEFVGIGQRGSQNAFQAVEEFGLGDANEIANARIGLAIGDEQPLDARPCGCAPEFVTPARSRRSLESGIQLFHCLLDCTR
jgi:hypothetical protein